MEITLENYNFKKAIQQLVTVNVIPVLLSNNFKKYKSNHFVREVDDLVQIISFVIEKYSLRAYAYFLPIYIPCDTSYQYGIEITGTSGWNLLSGKYITTFYEAEKKDTEIQFNNFLQIHKLNFEKLVNNIKNGVLPEMERINSLGKFINILENDNEVIFGNKYGRSRHISNIDIFTIAVFRCLSGKYDEGKRQLILLKKQLESSGELKYDLEKNIYRYIEDILPALDELNEFTYKRFDSKYKIICDEMRIKYRLAGSL